MTLHTNINTKEPGTEQLQSGQSHYHSWAQWHTPVIPAVGGRGRGITTSSKSAWSTQSAPGQSGPHSKFLSRKELCILFFVYQTTLATT